MFTSYNHNNTDNLVFAMLLEIPSEEYDTRVNSDYTNNNEYTSSECAGIAHNLWVSETSTSSDTFDTLDDPTVKTRIIVGVHLNIVGMFAVFVVYGTLFLNIFDPDDIGLEMYIFNLAILIIFLMTLFMFFSDIIMHYYPFCKCRLAEKHFYYNIQHASLLFAVVSLVLSVVTFVMYNDAVFFISFVVLFAVDNIIRHKRNAYFYDRRTLLDVFLLRTP